jgi:hypothetical protein
MVEYWLYEITYYYRPYTLEGNEIMQELQSKQERIVAVS